MKARWAFGWVVIGLVTAGVIYIGVTPSEACACDKFITDLDVALFQRAEGGDPKAIRELIAYYREQGNDGEVSFWEKRLAEGAGGTP